MVPSAFVVLERLPLLPSGKVNRKALPAPELADLGGQACHVDPRGPVEEAIAAIFAEVLKLPAERSAPTRASRAGWPLAARTFRSSPGSGRPFRRELPLRALFDAPDHRLLAKRVARRCARKRASSCRRSSASPAIARSASPLRKSASGSSISSSRGAPPTTCLSAIRLDGPLDEPALHRALRELVRRHEVLRTTFAAVEGRPFQIIHDEVTLRSRSTISPAPCPEERERGSARARADEPGAPSISPGAAAPRAPLHPRSRASMSSW
jgi:hypothetical protein